MFLLWFYLQAFFFFFFKYWEILTKIQFSSWQGKLHFSTKILCKLSILTNLFLIIFMKLKNLVIILVINKKRKKIIIMWVLRTSKLYVLMKFLQKLLILVHIFLWNNFSQILVSEINHEIKIIYLNISKCM